MTTTRDTDAATWPELYEALFGSQLSGRSVEIIQQELDEDIKGWTARELKDALRYVSKTRRLTAATGGYQVNRPPQYWEMTQAMLLLRDTAERRRQESSPLNPAHWPDASERSPEWMREHGYANGRASHETQA